MKEPEERQERLKKTILQYSEMVYRLAYALVKDKYDADDIYQEVFAGYIRKNPQFQNEEHEKAWFIRATVNRCKNFWKSAWQSRTGGSYGVYALDVSSTGGCICGESGRNSIVFLDLYDSGFS